MTGAFASSPSGRFQEAIRRIDAANAADPNPELVAGAPRPRELVYAERLTEWVLRLAPDASEALRLAARCQHICRWEIPRAAYPMDRAGYLRWRAELKKFHAAKSESLLRPLGYPEDLIQRVKDLNLKRDLSDDPEMQVLEDALCLVFLQFQFAELAAKTAPEKVVTALQKSWQKMSPAGRAAALRLNYTETEQKLLATALNSGNPGPN